MKKLITALVISLAPVGAAAYEGNDRILTHDPYTALPANMITYGYVARPVAVAPVYGYTAAPVAYGYRPAAVYGYTSSPAFYGGYVYRPRVYGYQSYGYRPVNRVVHNHYYAAPRRTYYGYRNGNGNGYGYVSRSYHQPVRVRERYQERVYYK